MLVLASQSPRRRDILTAAGMAFEVRSAEVAEIRHPDEDPAAYVSRLARAKAEAVPLRPEDVILGADTVVLLGRDVLEKPRDSHDALRMLRLLSGQEHKVLTGICLRSTERTTVDWAETTVFFSLLADDEIEAYVESGEPLGKAGAYAIQGFASKFINRIEGCYFNVVGLPMSLVYRHLRNFR